MPLPETGLNSNVPIQEDPAMPRVKPKPEANGLSEIPAGSDVLTLAEAAAYLRVAEQEVLHMIGTQALPGRKFGQEWRFFRGALQDWLSAAPGKKGLLSQLGAIKDDPYAAEMLKEIYQRRGRPETEES